MMRVRTAHLYSKADIHIHTTFSDGMATPEELVDFVVEQTDLRVIAVTDHDTAEGAFVARAYAVTHELPLDVIIGQEVTTDEGDVVGLFLRDSLPTYRTAAAAIDAIHGQGGLAIAVHPFSARWTLGMMKGLAARIADLPLDGVEVRNGFPTNFFSNPYTLWYNRWRGERISEVGGSDSHAVYTVGQACTKFPGTSAVDLRTAIASGETRAVGSLWMPGSMARVATQLLAGDFKGRAQASVYPHKSVEALRD